MSWRVSSVAVVNLRRGHTGRRLLATRGNERAAEAVGINVARTKLLGFAVLIGAGRRRRGADGLSPDDPLQISSFDELSGLSSLAFVYLGGITSVAGAAVGSLLVAGGVFQRLLRGGGGGGGPSFIGNAVAGMLLILITISYPDGLAAGVQRTLRRIGRRAARFVRGQRSRSARA